MIEIIKIATRGSDLALKQAEIAINLLTPVFGAGFSFEMVKIVTTGDKIQDRSLYDIGGKALFTKEIEEALLEERADIAVHSMKDVTAKFAEGLIFPSYFKRACPFDVIVGKYRTIEAIPAGGRIGTSSSRRALFVKNIRDDLEILPLRGNVPTRIKALEEGKYDAIILAAAGLERLSVDKNLYSLLPPEQFLPAVCQGVIGLQTRQGWKYNNLVSRTSDKDTEITTICERRFLEYFNADCKTPIAGFAQIKQEKLHFTGMYIDKKGTAIFDTGEGDLDNPALIAKLIAQKIEKCIS